MPLGNDEQFEKLAQLVCDSANDGPTGAQVFFKTFVEEGYKRSMNETAKDSLRNVFEFGLKAYCPEKISTWQIALKDLSGI